MNDNDMMESITQDDIMQDNMMQDNSIITIEEKEEKDSTPGDNKDVKHKKAPTGKKECKSDVTDLTYIQQDIKVSSTEGMLSPVRLEKKSDHTDDKQKKKRFDDPIQDRKLGEPTEYMIEFKVPIHLFYDESIKEGVNVNKVVSEQPTVNVDKIVRKDCSKSMLYTLLTEDEKKEYNNLMLSKDDRHEKRVINGHPIDIEPDRKRFIIRAYKAFLQTRVAVSNCLYGLCTLKRLSNICKTLVKGGKYMFLFRINNDYTKYATFTIKDYNRSTGETCVGLMQKTYRFLTTDDTFVVFKTYNKRRSGAVHMADTILNTIEFNFSAYIRVTGDMKLYCTTTESTTSFILNEIYILGF